MSLVEEYRPHTWEDVVGQDHIRKEIENLRPRGLGARGYWLQGPTGTGKTTIARIIAAEMAEDWATDEFDGADMTASKLEEIRRQFYTRPIGGKGWSWICNEAHRLRSDMVTRLLTLIEALPPFGLIVFTTTNEAQQELFDRKQDAFPFLTRCSEFETRVDITRFALYAKRVAERAQLDGAPLDAYIRLLKRCHGSLRAALQSIEKGEMQR